jgi:[ribosomal protein S18]-alanine N-acetyltransferase
MAAPLTGASAHHLRPMSTEDLDAVLVLERRLFAVDAWSPSMFRDELRAPDRHYLVAEAAGESGAAEVVGYAGLRAVPPQGDVQTIGVAESHWGRGIGAALLTAVLTEAERQGVREVFLDVRADNPRAQELYRRFGFTEIGARPAYYRDGVDSVVMCRTDHGGEPGHV